MWVFYLRTNFSGWFWFWNVFCCHSFFIFEFPLGSISRLSLSSFCEPLKYLYRNCQTFGNKDLTQRLASFPAPYQTANCSIAHWHCLLFVTTLITVCLSPASDSFLGSACEGNITGWKGNVIVPHLCLLSFIPLVGSSGGLYVHIYITEVTLR